MRIHTHTRPITTQDKPLGKLTWNFNTATAMVDSEWVESKSRASSGFSNPAREKGGEGGHWRCIHELGARVQVEETGVLEGIRSALMLLEGVLEALEIRMTIVAF